ncbi:DUF6262 family protein [Streptomyces sp. NBC_01362]|uniref:DUF6262 family protein n=1 Tax=Streptomyces sp. NBC_01362 TaxID=2903839 RepID=UPI002E374182|nr:DUF6262 family protein [Streptomyces sp. NBC_01362]
MNRRLDETAPETVPPADRRIAALRQAAQDKHQQAVQRAEVGIRKLIKEGEEINFRAVARRAGVSLDFLYAHTDLRKRIETLRGQQQTEDRPPLRRPQPTTARSSIPLPKPFVVSAPPTASASKNSNSDWPPHTARSCACNA